MSADVAALIRAKVKARRALSATNRLAVNRWFISRRLRAALQSEAAQWDRVCDHADKVLARHVPCHPPAAPDHPDPHWCAWCTLQDAWPCPDVLDLAAAWGVTP